MKRLQKVLLWVKVKLFRIIEELLPFVYFYYISGKLIKKVNDVSFSDIEFYSKLPDEKIEKRLKDEHERAQKIDDKTSKFTLGLSISLSIISASASSVVKFLPENNLNNFIALLFGLSSLYMLSGGLLALGALKTLPKFGYGTSFEINKSTTILARSLIGQEKVNILRHIRNELSFMSLRNGFLIIFISLILCIIVLFNQIIPHDSGINVDLIICDFCTSFA
ncbi:hypothetical protein [Photobacterium damselae]|uniref:hypothetical protein n=1 Tax=Photobacterium damselae TaxID=38293 RepID=UPI001246B80D|nr:hypothetical protein [Photobacterium damselae]KAB1184349.1 hypothetical protein F6477_00015 [Photobacterium damselae subsp. damselae]MBF7101732.1 hypothetical protein [Photobacterium damselae]